MYRWVSVRDELGLNSPEFLIYAVGRCFLERRSSYINVKWDFISALNNILNLYLFILLNGMLRRAIAPPVLAVRSWFLKHWTFPLKITGFTFMQSFLSVSGFICLSLFSFSYYLSHIHRVTEMGWNNVSTVLYYKSFGCTDSFFCMNKNFFFFF